MVLLAVNDNFIHVFHVVHFQQDCRGPMGAGSCVIDSVEFHTDTHGVQFGITLQSLGQREVGDKRVKFPIEPSKNPD